MAGGTHIEHFKVRDYECDMQGVVNNAVYHNYLEHARHEYLHSVGVDFAGLAQVGIDLVVVRSEVDYRLPLRSGDEFLIATRMERTSRLRFAFFQDVRRKADDKIVVQAKIIGTALNERGRPQVPEVLEQALRE